MDEPFPFGFPPPTASYLALYVITFALHHGLMHYVVAGCLYLAGLGITRRRPAGSQDDALAAVLRDWLPLFLSAAITAGIAPLLFVQVLYPERFYTANVLLSWRWMVVIPVLILAFYLLYVLKSQTMRSWPPLAQRLLVALVAASFLFVGFCWTANHLLANRDAAWPNVYLTGRLPLSASEIVLRMSIWGCGSFAGLATIAGWQLESNQTPAGLAARRTASRLAIGGLALASIACCVYVAWLAEGARAAVFGPLGRPYFMIVAVAVVIQFIGWTFQLRSAARGPLVVCSVAWPVMLLAAAVLRETVRLADIDVGLLASDHEAAAGVGGIAVFMTFTLVNAGFILYCVWLVRRRLSS